MEENGAARDCSARGQPAAGGGGESPPGAAADGGGLNASIVTGEARVSGARGSYPPATGGDDESLWANWRGVGKRDSVQ